MRLTICGSSTFRQQMVDYKKKLEELGHEGIIHPDYEAFVSGKKRELWERVQREHAVVKKERDYINWYYKAIKASDGILVLNFSKNGIENYVGGNTLMEIAFAYVHKKKIFLLNRIPDISYRDEIEAMYSEVLDGDLDRILI